MTALFFDTSALVKRYYEEPGTDTVDELLERDETVIISSLSIIETVSAFRRKYNRDHITERQMNQLVSTFFDEALADFTLLPIDETLIQHSIDLIMQDDLRTLDSLQLSAALTLPTETQVTFVTADQDLATTAHNRGLDILNPTE